MYPLGGVALAAGSFSESAEPEVTGGIAFSVSRIAGKSSVKTQAPTSKSVQSAARKADAKSSDTKPAAARLDMQGQVDLFAQAMKQFHQRNFAAAAPLFARVAEGPAPDIAHTARTHLKMCERRLEQDEAAPKTPEDHYAVGVALINRGDHKRAAEHLQQALRGIPDADHFHYAYALCAGLQGDLGLSAQHLQRAIELQPANRIAVRNDPDWATLARQSPIREILQPERGPSA